MTSAVMPAQRCNYVWIEISDLVRSVAPRGCAPESPALVNVAGGAGATDGAGVTDAA